MKKTCINGMDAKRDKFGHCHCEICDKKKKEYKKLWRNKNKDSRREYQIKYELDHKDERKLYRKEYLKANRDRQNKKSAEWQKNKIKTDLSFKIKTNMRSRIHRAIRNNSKSAKTIELIGCDIDFLRKHLESKFKENMSWDNYGKWEIDHILPCASFDLSIPDEQKKCFHYTNLQPLWEIENLIKGCKILH